MSELPPRPHKGETLPRSTETAPAPRIQLDFESKGRRQTIEVDGDDVRVGAHPSNDLVVDDPLVSRFHFRLRRGKTVWQLTDLGSLNGTRVSGVPVRDADLLPGCRIEIGDSIVTVREQPSTTSVPLHFAANLGGLFGTSVVMRRLFALLERVAQSEASVLVEGESGTGKELVATEIVKRGPRADRPLVIVDCASISPSLIESRLFGHTRGAFTGADRDRAGAFEEANGGTVFLDEIGELPLEMQPKLLRVLEAREVTRLGEVRPRPVDVRIVAATNRKLEREVNHGRFRDDLYFRLSVVTLRIPPLRERLEDLPTLVPAVLDELGASASASLFTPEVMGRFAEYDWPGNVRELRNAVERAVVLRTVDDLQADASPESLPDGGAGLRVDLDVPFGQAKERLVAEFERQYITALLAWSGGNISRAARRASMDRMNLHRLAQRYGLREARPFRD